MSTFKRTLTLLLSGLLLTQFVACTAGGQGATTTAAATTTVHPLAETQPVVAGLTAEEKAAYAALAVQNAERAHRLASSVEEYYIDGRGDNLNIAMYISSRNQAKRDTASVWHISAVLSMTSKLWSTNAGGQGTHYQELYGKILSTMDYYKGTGNITTYNGTTKQSMYAVNRASTKNGASLAGVAAVYDDQMWIIRELIYAYKLSGQEEYLTLALELTDVCLEGWDTTILNGKEVGGICWGPGYQTKHTCSNAPLIQPLVELYEVFRDEGRENAEYYLDWAKKIYSWSKQYLKMGSNLYGDLVGSSRKEEGSGKSKKYVTTDQSTGLDQNAYSYNTGAMISGAASLYRATGDNSYLTDAKNSAKQAFRSFGLTTKVDGTNMTQYKPKTTGVYDSQTTWFNLILLEGFIDLYPYDENCKKYLDAFQTSLDYAYDNHITEEGLLPRDLIGGWDYKNEMDSSKNIMDQASNAEIYAALAEFYTYLAAQ